MSTKTPSTTSNISTTKAAAKKKAKKATKGPLDDSSAPALAGGGGELFDVGQEDTEQLFNFPPGAYPAEFSYETSEYYDENPTPFSLPFPFDYGAPNGSFPPGINITNEDLVQTASELYRRMADPAFGNDDAYWSSLPPHLRQFIREAIPLSNTPGQKGPISEGQQGMWTMAQQIVSAASQGMGLGPGGGANLFRGVNGRAYGNGVAQELGFHRHPDAKEEYDDEDDFDLDEPYPANGEVAKKKKNKKKKKSGAVEPPPPPAPVKQPPRQTPQLNPPPPPSTPAPTNPPPSSRAAGKQPMSSTNPPARSARAAGKAPASATPAHNHHHNHAPKPAAKGKAPANAPPAKIWTQASVEDRENIRQFWLTLNEAERRDLLLIEKDTVLRKMKEQHRHMCGCAVCRRKKVTIESELDQLYEQYYDELSHYAMEQRAAANGLQAYPLGAGPFPGSVEVDATGQVTRPDHRAPDPKAIPPDDIIGDEGSEEYDDEEYDDEDDLEDEDDLGSEESDPNATEVPPPVQPPRQPKAPPKAVAPRADGTSDFLTYGNALSTIKGILTVADDLLRNDGGKFAEMMEQLAVARNAWVEKAPEPPNGDDQEPFTDHERYEEGKRMFQIFAARMFEQRVLQAYRERVAKSREEQLLRELEAEDDAKKAKEEKKAKEAQKKKDKKKLQKQRQDEEKAAKDAALAAEQEAVRAKAAEAERERVRKLEEERARREAVKKAAQEEQARVAAERRKRQQEEKDREEEAAKKKREREEKARREREAREKEIKEKERKEREAKAAREKLEKERQAEKERLAKEAKAKAQREAKEREERLQAERIEKAQKQEEARKEREAAEKAKTLALAQERERKAAEKAAEERERAIRQPVAPVPVRAAVSAFSPQTTPPAEIPSPVKPSASGSRAVRPQQKTPAAYYPQPAPATASYSNRMSLPQTYNYRQYPGQSPVFSPPTSNGPSTSISPNPPARGFAPEPSPPYDLGPRTAPPIGMGFPTSTKSMNRIPSIDEAFSPPSGPFISQPSSRHVSGEEEYRSSAPAPIAPPGPIGRPVSYVDPSQKVSPNVPEKQLGSAALGGGDDEIVPTRRNLSNGWGGDLPIAAAPGSGRWSSAPGTAGASIWGSSSTAPEPPAASPWGNNLMPSSSAARQSSFSQAIGSPFSQSAQPGHNAFGSQPIGSLAAPGASAPGAGPAPGAPGSAAFTQGLFSPPGLAGTHHAQPHHHYQHR